MHGHQSGRGSYLEFGSVVKEELSSILFIAMVSICSDSGAVQLKHLCVIIFQLDQRFKESFLRVFPIFSSIAEWNHLYNFDRGHKEERLREIIGI